VPDIICWDKKLFWSIYSLPDGKRPDRIPIYCACLAEARLNMSLLGINLLL